MAQITETFAVASEQVTVALDVALPAGGGETILTGAIGGVVPAGTVARLRGACLLTADLHVRGTLLCDSTGVDLDGQNLFDIHTHDGTVNLQGVAKTGWVRWGDPVVGWEVGDRLGVAPTATRFRVDGKMLGEFLPAETTWQGSWEATVRPPISPPKVLFNGTVMEPEVANLTRSVTLRNLKRIMFHEASAPNPHTLKWIRVLDCGEEGVLGHYPIHFHLLGDWSRGSLVEGVVVEGGKNHAIVPHGSHGVTVRDFVAFKTKNHAIWWDDPIDHDPDDPNNSDDSDWDHVLALDVTFNKDLSAANWHGLAAFQLGAGSRNRLVDSVAAAVRGGSSSTGYHWPSKAAADAGGDNVWEFTGNVAHNCVEHGSRVWQNDNNPHVVSNLTVYNCGSFLMQHGAYLNRYQYDHLLLDGANGFVLQALSRGQEIRLSDVTTNGILRIGDHSAQQPDPLPSRLIRCTFTQVVYTELSSNPNLSPSHIIYEDCGLTPADFDLAAVHAESVIEILEGGTLTDRWQSGVWS